MKGLVLFDKLLKPILSFHQLMRQIMNYETGLNSISCHRKPENARFVTMTPYDWDGHLEYMKGGQLMIEEQFAQYLIEEKGFHRIVELWIRQYQRLQHFGGKVCITDPEDDEREAIGALLGKDYWGVRDISIPYTVWKKGIEESRFTGSDFLHVLEIYKGEKILTNKELKKLKSQKEQKEAEALLKRYENTKAGEWLCWMQKTNHKSYGNIRQLMNNEKQQTVYYILDAINQLPVWKQEMKTLAVFASSISQDPHFFDKGIENTLLLQGICYIFEVEEQDLNLAEKNKLYYDAGLLKDDLSNICMIAHLNGIYKDGTAHTAWAAFFNLYEAWTVSLYNLQQINSIAIDIRKVYIVENPSVFRSLFLEGKRLEKDHIGFVCTNGQLNLCGYVLLDLIQKSGIPMYYAGDFDPEGILIADKLKQRYKDNLHLWKSSVEEYRAILSSSSISEKRLLSLQSCRSEELQALCRELEQYKYSGYQEALLPLYLEEIRNA